MVPVPERRIRIKSLLFFPSIFNRLFRFVASTSATMNWKFFPQQKEVTVPFPTFPRTLIWMKVVPGETALAFFTAINTTDEAITGISTYNVLPFEVWQLVHILDYAHSSIVYTLTQACVCAAMHFHDRAGWAIFQQNPMFLLRRATAESERGGKLPRLGVIGCQWPSN